MNFTDLVNKFLDNANVGKVVADGGSGLALSIPLLMILGLSSNMSVIPADTIKETLEKGEKIKISGFGNFVVRDKNARAGRNPQTGQEITISARRVLTFKPSQVLKNILNPLKAAAKKKAADAGKTEPEAQSAE